MSSDVLDDVLHGTLLGGSFNVAHNVKSTENCFLECLVTADSLNGQILERDTESFVWVVVKLFIGNIFPQMLFEPTSRGTSLSITFDIVGFGSRDGRLLTLFC